MSDVDTATGSTLKEAPTALTTLIDVKFNFKKPDPITNTKRPPVEVKIPVLTLNGLIDFLQADDPKVAANNQQFVLDLLAGEVKEAARQQISSDEKPVNTQDELDFSKLDLTYIANLPPAERVAGGISQEIWEAFGAAYLAIMPAKTGKPAENVQNAVTLLVKKLVPCKTRKDVLKTLKDQLDLFYTSINEDQQEEFKGVYEYLSKKADDYMNSDQLEQVMSNL